MIHPPFAHKFHQDNSHPWHTKSDSKNLYIHKLYISHKNQEISIFTTKKKQSKVKTFSTSHREFQVKTKQRIKDQETKNQVNVKAVRTTVPVSTLFRDHQFMYIYKMQIGIDVIKQALLLEEVETTLHHVKIEHIVRCLQAAKPYYKQFNFSSLNPHSKLKILGSTLTGQKLVGTMD
jgi:hypothetical protein